MHFCLSEVQDKSEVSYRKPLKVSETHYYYIAFHEGGSSFLFIFEFVKST